MTDPEADLDLVAGLHLIDEHVVVVIESVPLQVTHLLEDLVHMIMIHVVHVVEVKVIRRELNVQEEHHVADQDHIVRAEVEL